MGRYARKKGKAASCKGIGRRGGKTKTRTRDLDQINEDLKKNIVDELYCVHCARFFQSSDILSKHLVSKIHKRRVKRLKDVIDE